MSNNELQSQSDLLGNLCQIIEDAKAHLSKKVNAALTLTYWNVGKRINDELLSEKRADYGKKILEELSKKLTQLYGSSFSKRNLRRMMQFAKLFPDLSIVAPLAPQLSWTHLTIVLNLEDETARQFYIKHSIENHWSKRELQRQIERKAFERSEIADTKQSLNENEELISHFKDPYFLDFLGLKDGYLENELESALIKELEHFILELGNGFAFVERQKRMIIDGEDFYLDLLFYHRKLKRLVAVELKIGRFKAAFKGQMELYLNWLNKYERQEGEEAPIALILCAEAGTEQIELLNMQKDNILVAEYWTELPPKALLEEKLHAALVETRQRFEERHLLNQANQNLEEKDV